MSVVGVPLALLAGLVACTSAPPSDPSTSPSRAEPVPASTPVPTVTIALRLERRVAEGVETFETVVHETLTDSRGWTGAGFEFVFAEDAPYTIVLAEGPEVDALCLPYDTYGAYSCQNGPVVALNADRWRSATPQWTGDLEAYRQMLVNHEVGHLLGRHHPPAPQCPAPGAPAPIMAQQSTELDGCRPNPWPLPEELAAAARHDAPLAPPYEAPD